MSLYLSLAGLMAVAIFTPGPNNLLALSATTRGRFADGLPIMFGVVVGMTAVFILLLAGFTALGAATSMVLPSRPGTASPSSRSPTPRLW